MNEYELLIAIKDEEDINGLIRKKAGDIIACKPRPWAWGRKEICHYLVVPIRNLSKDTLNKFISPLYDTIKYLDEMTDEEQYNTTIIKKRRHCIPLELLKTGWCTTLDLMRVANPEDVYQPLKDNNIVMDFDEHVKNVLDKQNDSFRYDTEKVIE